MIIYYGFMGIGEKLIEDGLEYEKNITVYV
jgi:hypothetical protein